VVECADWRIELGSVNARFDPWATIRGNLGETRLIDFPFAVFAAFASVSRDHAVPMTAICRLELFASELLLMSLACSPQFRVSLLVFSSLEYFFFLLKLSARMSPGLRGICFFYARDDRIALKSIHLLFYL
jgi:hypothetical protein